jgi:hypothetical protein
MKRMLIHTLIKMRLRVKTYVENLADRCYSQSLPKDAPRSLQAACGELQRLLSLLEQ